jgi:hypothetical protein
MISSITNENSFYYFLGDVFISLLSSFSNSFNLFSAISSLTVDNVFLNVDFLIAELNQINCCLFGIYYHLKH